MTDDGRYLSTLQDLLKSTTPSYDVTDEFYEANIHGGVDKVVFSNLFPDFTEAQLQQGTTRESRLANPPNRQLATSCCSPILG